MPRPVDIARSILFLVSPVARFITGDSLRVDGGWTALARRRPIKTTAINVGNRSPKVCIIMVSATPCRGIESVNEDRGNEDHPQDDQLQEAVDLQQVHTVLQDGD
ncbi:hypothetical protein FJ414_07610 [Mesorhizobium sp. B3-1-6]|nr:hypothetical protein FJ414_07610 [Mesorhizobium sp. B3-1-6]